MVVNLLVVLVVLVFLDCLRPGARATQIDLTRMLRAYGTQRKHPLQIFTLALRTGGNVTLTHKLLEGLFAFSTGVFVNRHRKRKNNRAPQARSMTAHSLRDSDTEIAFTSSCTSLAELRRPRSSQLPSHPESRSHTGRRERFSTGTFLSRSGRSGLWLSRPRVWSSSR